MEPPTLAWLKSHSESWRSKRDEIAVGRLLRKRGPVGFVAASAAADDDMAAELDDDEEIERLAEVRGIGSPLPS